MNAPSFVRSLSLALGFLAVTVCLALSVQLRLIDPFASPVLPAEDTFNHMALVHEHVRDGSLDPLYEGGRLYPPGMHALIAAVWGFTGLELYEIMRFMPVVMGAVGVLGIGLLLWRSDGPIAAALGALAYAVMPEVIRRTTMMAPTAVDLALIPFFLYATLRLVQGRLGWAGAAAPIALFLVFTHPWLLTILALAGAVFAIALMVRPWPRARGEPVSGFGLAIALTILGVGWALSLTGCGGACGPGFDDVTEDGPQIDALAPVVAGLALVTASFFALFTRVDKFLARDPAPIAGWSLRIISSVLLGAVLVLVTLPAVEQGMPPDVDLPVKIGWGVLVAAILGLLLVPFAPSAAGYLGLGISAVTYPFVIYNPFNSPFWSHRTMAFLGVGLALLAGVAAGVLGRWLVALIMRLPTRLPATRAARPVFASLAVLIFLSASTSQVYAATPDPPGWYRLYNPCEHDAMEVIAEQARDDPEVILITGSWQAKLILAAITPHAGRVWFMQSFFTNESQREKIEEWGPPMIVVVERHLPAITPRADLGFLNETEWQPIGAWCQRPNVVGPTVQAYAWTGGR